MTRETFPVTNSIVKRIEGFCFGTSIPEGLWSQSWFYDSIQQKQLTYAHFQMHSTLCCWRMHTSKCTAHCVVDVCTLPNAQHTVLLTYTHFQMHSTLCCWRMHTSKCTAHCVVDVYTLPNAQHTVLLTYAHFQMHSTLCCTSTLSFRVTLSTATTFAVPSPSRWQGVFPPVDALTMIGHWPSSENVILNSAAPESSVQRHSSCDRCDWGDSVWQSLFSSSTVTCGGEKGGKLSFASFQGALWIAFNKSASRGGAPQASYDKHRHRNCFQTWPTQAFPKM